RKEVEVDLVRNHVYVVDPAQLSGHLLALHDDRVDVPSQRSTAGPADTARQRRSAGRSHRSEEIVTVEREHHGNNALRSGNDTHIAVMRVNDVDIATAEALSQSRNRRRVHELP